MNWNWIKFKKIPCVEYLFDIYFFDHKRFSFENIKKQFDCIWLWVFWKINKIFHKWFFIWLKIIVDIKEANLLLDLISQSYKIIVKSTKESKHLLKYEQIVLMRKSKIEIPQNIMHFGKLKKDSSYRKPLVNSERLKHLLYKFQILKYSRKEKRKTRYEWIFRNQWCSRISKYQMSLWKIMK
jgi:hypothetical protein